MVTRGPAALAEIGSRVAEAWKQASARLCELDQAGRFVPPCDDGCTGQIVTDVLGTPTRTDCPAYRRPGVCRILQWEEAIIERDMVEIRAMLSESLFIIFSLDVRFFSVIVWYMSLNLSAITMFSSLPFLEFASVFIFL